MKDVSPATCSTTSLATSSVVKQNLGSRVRDAMYISSKRQQTFCSSKKKKKKKNLPRYMIGGLFLDMAEQN